MEQNRPPSPELSPTEVEMLVEGIGPHERPADAANETKEQVHERLVEDAVELAAGVYRARTKREPDQKYLDQMREIYRMGTERVLEAKVGDLLKELESLSGM